MFTTRPSRSQALSKGDLSALGSEAEPKDLFVVPKGIGAKLQAGDPAPIAPDLSKDFFCRCLGQGFP